MLASLCRMTLTVIAALLVSFVDGTFDDNGQSMRPADATVLLAHQEFDDGVGLAGPSIERIGQQSTGADDVALRAWVGAPGLTCALKITYEDGGTDVLDDVIADPGGVCSSRFAVANRDTAVGTAEVELAVMSASGEIEAEATQAFIVK